MTTAMAKRGRPKKQGSEREPDAKVHAVVVHLSATEKERVQEAAQAQERPVSYWIRKAILRALEVEAEE